MDLKEIKSVIDLMTKNGLSEFELEKGDFKLRVKRGPTGEWVATTTPTSTTIAASHHAPATAAPVPMPSISATSAAPAPSTHSQIVSPMVGTFYRSPSPDSAPYIE